MDASLQVEQDSASSLESITPMEVDSLRRVESPGLGCRITDRNSVKFPTVCCIHDSHGHSQISGDESFGETRR